MAAPQGQLRVSRHLAVLAVILVALYALVFFTGPGSWRDWQDKLEPRLGLDLQGGTTVTLRASQPDGRVPALDQLREARQIIENRVNGTGVAEAEVIIEGNSNIVVNVPGRNNDDIKKIGQPAQLKFRQVLQETDDIPEAPEETPSPSGSASATPSASPSAKVSSSPPASAGASPSASPKTAASASPTPKPSASASATPGSKPTTQQVMAKFHPQVLQLLQQATTPEQLQQLADPRLALVFAPIKDLTPAEIAVLPVDFQFKVPYITCARLESRPPGSVDDPEKQVVACDPKAKKKYLLDKAAVVGTDVDTASFDFVAEEGWRVNLKFTGTGQSKWTALTKKALNKQVAAVLDNTVVSAPVIQSVIAGDAQITGTFSKEEVADLASKLKYGALPLSFTLEEDRTISPTLGIEQLKGGLLAGGIGLGLVVVYSLLYYRGLGFVTIASLLASASIIFAAVILLGRQIGFTLTLAGVAGFIVAVGITADSFVVFFERLKDEVKDGRTVRSSVPRAWVRARRTILSADAVSFLAAAVLYILAAGAVRGFAFTLGLSTLVDVLIVFLFTHPLVALLSRLRGFTSPRFSGLGNLKPDAPAVAAATTGAGRRVTPKES